MNDHPTARFSTTVGGRMSSGTVYPPQASAATEPIPISTASTATVVDAARLT